MITVNEADANVHLDATAAACPFKDPALAQGGLPVKPNQHCILSHESAIESVPTGPTN